MRKWQVITTALLAATVVLLLINYGNIRTLTSEVTELRELREASMQTMTSTWTSGGTTHTVTTPRNENESNEDWGKRHKDSLDEMQSLFPPD